MESTPVDRTLISVQFLRALAAVMVVYHHAAVILFDTAVLPEFGKFGVDLFFVISGFVMAHVASQTPRASHFILQRIVRIVPLYWLATTPLFILGLVMPQVPATVNALTVYFLQSLFFIPYIRESGTFYPMLLTGWTLNYEMLFYAVMAVAIAWGRLSLIVSAVTMLTALYLASYLLASDSALAIMLHRDLLFEFLLGMVIFYLLPKLKNRFLLDKAAAFVVPFLLLMMVDRELKGATNGFADFGIPSFFILLFMLLSELHWQAMGSQLRRCILFGGNASYAIYLTHIYVIEGVNRLVLTAIPALKTNPLTAVGAIGVSILLGVFTYWYVDKPIVRYLKMRLIWFFTPTKDNKS